MKSMSKMFNALRGASSSPRKSAEEDMSDESKTSSRLPALEGSSTESRAPIARARDRPRQSINLMALPSVSLSSFLDPADFSTSAAPIEVPNLSEEDMHRWLDDDSTPPTETWVREALRDASSGSAQASPRVYRTTPYIRHPRPSPEMLLLVEDRGC
ncbi:hypothetical protein T484DRAFT_1749437 [Baffinella frigidus]|nr:hypothetical protein T484DRAFT_1749437 [Cryptophyta sp. CCMP2293]